MSMLPWSWRYLAKGESLFLSLVDDDDDEDGFDLPLLPLLP